MVLRLLHRDYEVAALLLPACAADEPLTEEQAWILSLVASPLDAKATDVPDTHADAQKKDVDPHPDAIAVRLRLALICFNCGSTPPFDVREDFQQCVAADAL